MRATAKDALADLKRMLLHLTQLDGVRVDCLEGPHLVHPRRVTDPLALLDAVREAAGLTLPALIAHAELVQPPRRLEPRMLAQAQHHLKVLAANPALIDQVNDARALRRLLGTDARGAPVRLDRAWLATRERRLEALSAGPAPAPDLVTLFRGPEAARAVERWRARSLRWSLERRATLRRRFLALGDAGARCDLPDEVLRAFRAEVSQRGRGRSRDRHLARLLARVAAWPDPPRHTDDPPPAPLPARPLDALRVAGEHALAALPSTRHPEYLARLERALVLLALRYRLEPDGALSPAQVSRVLGELGRRETWDGTEPTLTASQGLAVLALRLPAHQRGRVEAHVARGLEVALVEGLATAGKLEEALRIADTGGLRAWARWTLELAPALRARGVELTLPTTAFSTSVAARDQQVALFAQAMLATGKGDRPDPATLLARLDAVLALVDHAPKAARALVASLEARDPGAGRQHFPEFAAWLDDDARLDQLCALQRLAGEPPSLPRALLRDFERQDRLGRERDHLQALASPTPAQQVRLARVAVQLAQASEREWTRRRLEERTASARNRALEVRLDAVLCDALHDAFGLTPPALTGAWRDAVRFFLSVDKNRELLGTLLRHAAHQPGVPLDRILPANRRWIEASAAHFDVEAWLAPRRVELRAGGRTLTLSTEDDPLEVLRMGIPFGTCLSLLDGCNAASTVLNALDANKRVLYVRTADGTIVGRKLLAVSRRHQLLGYRLYLAVEREAHPAIEKAVGALCQQLSDEARLPLADAGEPARLHDGFWYDDGTVPFGATGETSGDVAAFCTALGQPVVADESLEVEAQLFRACRDGAVDEVLSLLPDWNLREPWLGAARWLADRLGTAELAARGGRRATVQVVLLERTLAESPLRMLGLLGRLESLQTESWEHARRLLDTCPSAAGLVRGLAQAARAQCGRRRYDDHGIEHGTLWALPGLAARTPVAEVLETLDRLAPVWEYVVQQESSCRECVDDATRRTARALEQAWAAEPDPEALLRCLGDHGRSEAALRCALSLAARFPLARTRREAAPLPVGTRLLEGAPVGCPRALQALKLLRERRPSLATTPEFAAAWLRQGGAADGLPTPATPPFEALGSLAFFRPDEVTTLCTPFTARLSRYPGPWELYHHRRHRTRWVQEVERRGCESEVWPAAVGVGARKGTTPAPDQPFAGWREAPRLVSAVRAQLAGQDDDVDPATLPDAAIDPAYQRRALARLSEAKGAGRVEAARRLGPSSAPELCELLTELLEIGAGGDALVPLVRALAARCTWNRPELPPGLAARLADFDEVRPLLVELLRGLEPTDREGWVAKLKGFAPAASGTTKLLTDLFRAWAKAPGDEFTTNPEDLVERLLAACTTPAEAIAVWFTAPTFAASSRLLPALLSRFGAEALVPYTQQKASGFRGVRLRWLSHACGVTHPVSTKAPSRKQRSR